MVRVAAWIGATSSAQHGPRQRLRHHRHHRLHQDQVHHRADRGVGPDLSHFDASDFKNPEIVCISIATARLQRDKAEERELLKLLWDCMATEFGGRHELYEINDGGSIKDIPPLPPVRRPGVGQRRPLQGLRRGVHGGVRPRRAGRCPISPIPAKLSYHVMRGAGAVATSATPKSSGCCGSVDAGTRLAFLRRSEAQARVLGTSLVIFSTVEVFYAHQ